MSFQGEGKTNGGREEDVGKRGRKGLRGCEEGGERGKGGRSVFDKKAEGAHWK